MNELEVLELWVTMVRHIPRQFFPAALVTGARVALPRDVVDKLVRVFRAESGYPFRLFDDVYGEYHCKLLGALRPGPQGTGEVGAKVRTGLRASTNELPWPILFAPTLAKREAVHYMLEKCTEVGVGTIAVCQGERSQKEKGTATDTDGKDGTSAWQSSLMKQYSAALGGAPGPPLCEKTARLHHMWVQQATEQCGRLSVPPIFSSRRTLHTVLCAWTESSSDLPSNRHLLVCDEAEGGSSHSRLDHAVHVVRQLHSATAMAAPHFAIAIGPEGGWSDDERAAVRAACGASSAGRVHRVSLGPNVLRAETAAVAALIQLDSGLQLDRVR